VLRGQLGHASYLAWQVFGEPTLAQTYTPRAGDVFASIDREAARIGWGRIWRYGRVKGIRKTDDGRYLVAYSQVNPQTGSQNRLMLCNYLHLAVGYPGVRFLPDLQEYRERTKDFKTVVNAYESHEHVYDHLHRHGGVILIRGRGIVASRIIQRIYELRRKNPRIAVLHLMRSPIAAGNRYGKAQRVVDAHWEFQPFNWPKACWGGELRELLESSNDQQRDQLLNDWGGTTTADRVDWREIVNTGLREGWYQIRFGDVSRVEKNESGRLVTIIKGKGGFTEESHLTTDFIVDCTGLEATVDSNPLLKDMVDHYRLGKNPKGRLRVANDFSVIGMENGPGRMFAAGAMTLGGPYAAVDSFLGLQYAALRSVEALTRLRAPGLRGLGTFRSLGQWLRWARGVHP
jgi:pSer/pThr/pTyr-binding forkhead associated (FHA) protein